MSEFDVLKNEINEMRKELDILIENGGDYEKIYNASVKLDKLIDKETELQLKERLGE